MDTLSKALAFRFALLAIFILCVSIALTQSTERKSLKLHIGFTRSSFIGVNEMDAKAAFKVFAMRMGEKRGYDVTPYVHIFDDIADIATEIHRDTQDLVILDTWDYLTCAPFTNMPIEVVPIEQGVLTEPYLLLVRADRGISSIAELSGKHVIVLENCNANNGQHWLRTELLALGFADPRIFFQSMDIEEKVAQVVLPVFFGKADACVVDRSGFVVMSEMNPKVGETLSVLAQSESYLDSICCVRRSGWEKEWHRSDLIAALKEIPKDTAGKQIMTLFKFNDVKPFDDHYLDTIRALRAHHDALAKELGRGGSQRGVK